MEKKTKTIASRKYISLFTNATFNINADVKNKQYLYIDFDNTDGYIFFYLDNLDNNWNLLINKEEIGTHQIPLSSGNKYKLSIKSKNAKGYYVIKLETIIEDD